MITFQSLVGMMRITIMEMPKMEHFLTENMEEIPVMNIAHTAHHSVSFSFLFFPFLFKGLDYLY